MDWGWQQSNQMMNSTQDTVERKLVRAGGFNPDDLVFNQAGMLSQRQKHWLMLEVAGWVTQAGINLMLIICAWGVYYLQFLHNLKVFLAGGLFWSFIIGFSILLCIEHARPLWMDIQNGQVEQISGLLIKYHGRGKNISTGRSVSGIHYTVRIRNCGFSVYPSIYAAIVEHQSYRLFYLPNAKKLVNIEPLFENIT